MTSENVLKPSVSHGNEIIGTDETPSHRDNELVDIKPQKHYESASTTILDTSVGTAMNRTLTFLTNSSETYLKKLYEADTLLGYVPDSALTTTQTISKHLVAVSLFCKDGETAIYLGILLIGLSLIIYFLSIVSPSDGSRERRVD
jgi:hypothetical protein